MSRQAKKQTLADSGVLFDAFIENWQSLEEEERRLSDEHRKVVEKRLEQLRETYGQLVKLIGGTPGAAPLMRGSVKLTEEMPTSCYHVLRALLQKPNEPVQMRSLHDQIVKNSGPDYDKSTLSDAVRRLFGAGLITKEKDHEGGRQSKYVISLRRPIPERILNRLPRELRQMAGSA